LEAELVPEPDGPGAAKPETEPRPANPDDPYQQVEAVLRGVNEALGGEPDAVIPRLDVTRHLNARSSLRQLIEAVGIQGAIDLKVWAAKNRTGGLDWSVLLRERATLLHQMRNPVKPPGKPRESVVDQAEEAKRRMRERLGVAA
jgi:hypothetical protein